MKYKVYTLNSFVKDQSGGNAAGVMLGADGLSDETMMAIANKVGFSETAFIQKSDKADFRVRFFTPNSEVDLCGHATIAAFHLLRAHNRISEGQYKQETKAGILGIEVRGDGGILMEQSLPSFYEILDKAEAAHCMNLKASDLHANLPVQIVSTGLRDIMLPVKDLDTLLHMQADMDRITEISRKYDAVGIHAFTLESKYKATAHCRNFAPLYDIPEESATGTSNGALSCYLFQHGILTEKTVDSLAFEQGYSMGQPSEILAKLLISEGRIREVRVGGFAAVTGELEFDI